MTFTKKQIERKERRAAIRIQNSSSTKMSMAEAKRELKRRKEQGPA